MGEAYGARQGAYRVEAARQRLCALGLRWLYGKDVRHRVSRRKRSCICGVRRSHVDVSSSRGHVSFVLLNYDSGTLTMVVDKQKKSKAISLATESGEFAIGGERRTYNEGVLHYFDGDIDDVRVWDRALTEAEIAALEADR